MASDITRRLEAAKNRGITKAQTVIDELKELDVILGELEIDIGELESVELDEDNLIGSIKQAIDTILTSMHNHRTDIVPLICITEMNKDIKQKIADGSISRDAAERFREWADETYKDKIENVDALKSTLNTLANDLKALLKADYEWSAKLNKDLDQLKDVVSSLLGEVNDL